MIQILKLTLIKYFLKWIIYGFKHISNQFKQFPNNSGMFYIFLFSFSITQLTLRYTIKKYIFIIPIESSIQI